MATSSSFFNLRRGSTKSLTFQVYRGVQVTKDRVGKPANPQSALQMEQRIKLAPVAQTRSALKFILNHSFEGVQYGQKSLLYFSKLNLDKNNDRVKFVSYLLPGWTGSSVASYQISKGSLTPLAFSVENTSIVFHLDETYTGDVPETVDSIIDIIFEKLGISDDGLLSFLYAVPTGSQNTAEIGNVTKACDILKWNVARISKSDASIKSAWIYRAGSNHDYITDGTTSIEVYVENVGLEMRITTANPEDPEDLVMGAAIHSERDGETWQRSTQYLVVAEGVPVTANNAITAAEAANALLKSSTSGYYLNSGGSGSSKLQWQEGDSLSD